MDYPRTGPIWGVSDTDNWPVADAARFDSIYLMGDCNPTYDAAVRAINPAIKILGGNTGMNNDETTVYPTIVDPASWPLPAMGEAAQPAWMLTNVGSTLASSIATTGYIVTPAAMRFATESGLNSSFVDGNSDGVPDGFTKYGAFDTDATVTVVGSAGHSGGSAVRVQQSTGATFGALIESASVTPGQLFYNSLWMKGTGTGWIGASYEVRDADDVFIEGAAFAAPGASWNQIIALDGEWHELVRYYAVPERAATINLFISRYDGGTEATDFYASDLTATEMNLFDEGSLAVIGDETHGNYELVRIGTVGASTLTLDSRGIGNAGVHTHAAGSRIAQVVCIWGVTTPVMDLTNVCPTVDVGHGAETWVDYCIRSHSEWLAASDWDGLMVDDADGSKGWIVAAGKTRNIDVDRSNTLVTDYTDFNTAWNVGARAISSELRAIIGDAILIENQPVPNPTAYDGAYREEQPTAAWDLAMWNLVIRGPYDSVPDHMSMFDEVAAGRTPTYTSLGPYAVTSPPSDTDYRVMRFGLTSCLLIGAPFLWEPQGHDVNTRLWADEFDNAGAGKGYMGAPLGTAPTLLPSGVWIREYEHALNLCNPTDASQTVALGATYTKINGSQQPDINDGSAVSSVTIPSHDGIILLRPFVHDSASWETNQASDVSAPSVLVGTVETHQMVDTTPVTNDWLADNLTAKNAITAQITSEFDYSRATLPFESCEVVVENAVYDGEPATGYDFVRPDIVEKLDAPGVISLSLGYRYDDGVIETVPMTQQILQPMTVSDDDLYATFKGLSFTSVMDPDIFYGGRYDPAGIPASTLFEEILTSARFPVRGHWNYILGADTCLVSDSLVLWDTDGHAYYTIDPAFDSVLVYIPIPPVSHREALTQLAAYVGAYLIHRDDGSLSVTSTLTDKPDYTVGEMRVYDRPKTDTGTRINRLTSTLSFYTADATTSTIFDGDLRLVNTDPVEVRITHDGCDSGSLDITSGGSISGTPVYNTYSTVFTVEPTSTTIHVTLTGKKVTISSQNFEKTYYASGDVVDVKCDIASDPAQLIAMLDHYNAVDSSTRFEFSMRDDAKLKVGDVVNLQLISDREYSVWNYILGDAACVVSATAPILTTRWDNYLSVVMQSIKRAFNGGTDATCVAVVSID
jgi:hypothetical protein